MRIHLTIDLDDAELLELIAPLHGPPGPAPRPGGPRPPGPNYPPPPVSPPPPRPSSRQPGEDPTEPEHLQPAAGVRPNGRDIYKWAIDRKLLPTVLKRAKALGISGKLTQMSDDDAAVLWAEIYKGKPIANGRRFGSSF